MAWLGMLRQGWSLGAGCGYQTSPAGSSRRCMRFITTPQLLCGKAGEVKGDTGPTDQGCALGS